MKVDASQYLQAVKNVEKERSALHHALFKAVTQCTKGWKETTFEELLSIEQVGGAMTNLVFIGRKKSSDSENANVLIRIYGEGTDAYFERSNELLLFKTLSNMNLGIQFLGEFENGRVEKLIHGTTATAACLLKPKEQKWIAQSLSQLHAIEIEKHLEKKNNVILKITEFYQMVKQVCKGCRYQQIDLDAIHQALLKYIAIDVLLVDSPLVFAHGDLQYGNIMLTENKAILIDFEYSDYNPRGFDLANHFCEWMFNYHSDTPHLGNIASFPTSAEQVTFCEAYLNSKDEEAIGKLMEEIAIYVPASHLFWGLWAMIQSSSSNIDFDYLKYAEFRLNLFLESSALNK